MKNLKRITELGQLKEFVDVSINDDFIESLGGRIYILDEEIDQFIHYLEDNGLDYSLIKSKREVELLEFINSKIRYIK